MHHVVDPHIFTSLKSSQAMYALSLTFPETDLVLELRELAKTQLDILLAFANHQHFGSKQLRVEMVYAEEIYQLAVEIVQNRLNERE